MAYHYPDEENHVDLLADDDNRDELADKFDMEH